MSVTLTGKELKALARLVTEAESGIPDIMPVTIFSGYDGSMKEHDRAAFVVAGTEVSYEADRLIAHARRHGS